MAALWPGLTASNRAASQDEQERLSEVVALVVARRTPLQDAEKQINSYLKGSGNERAERAQQLFVRAYDKLIAQRSQLISGLERADRRQKEFAAKIRADVAHLRTASGGEGTEAPQLTSQVEWETRVFDDRRKAIAYACEVPSEIDRRLAAIAQMLRKAIDAAD